MEALARWIDPKRGLLPPAAFIGPLERAQLVWKLDLCVIRQVVETLAGRIREGLPAIPISVNLSRLDFVCCDIYSEIEKLVRENDIPRRMLHLEVTESILTSREDGILKTLDHFRDAGYEIWMDDFGSGYSTLNLLKDCSFDVLKLDMAFLKDDTPRSREIIASVIEMDKRIGNRSLAEGVETKEQADFLKECGCEKLQGYYFGKPLPFDEALSHCREQGFTTESAREKIYYDAVGEVNFLTDVPLVLAEEEDGRVRLLAEPQDFTQYNGFPVSKIDPALLPPVLGGVGGLLVQADGTPLKEADCTVEGEMLVIRSDAIPKAREFRIFFAETAFCQVNLFNTAGIPALPFEKILVRN